MRYQASAVSGITNYFWVLEDLKRNVSFLSLRKISVTTDEKMRHDGEMFLSLVLDVCDHDKVQPGFFPPNLHYAPGVGKQETPFKPLIQIGFRSTVQI